MRRRSPRTAPLLEHPRATELVHGRFEHCRQPPSLRLAEFGGTLHEQPARPEDSGLVGGMVLSADSARVPDALSVAALAESRPHPLRGGVDRPDDVELVGDDAGLGQRLLDRPSIGPVTVDHDRLDPGSEPVVHA